LYNSFVLLIIYEAAYNKNVVYIVRIIFILLIFSACSFQKEEEFLRQPNVKRAIISNLEHHYGKINPEDLIIEPLDESLLELTLVNNELKYLSVYSIEYNELDKLRISQLYTLKGTLIGHLSNENPKLRVSRFSDVIVVILGNEKSQEFFSVSEYNSIFTEPSINLKFFRLNHETLSKLPFHIFFISSRFFDGNLGGFEGACEKCMSLAKGRFGLYRWMALIGNDLFVPSEKIKINGPVFNTRGQRVASNSNNFFRHELLSQIYDENANLVSSGEVWTGLTRHGMLSNLNCNNWSSSDSSLYGSFGISFFLSLEHPIGTWMGVEPFPCSELRHIYCISQ